MLKQPPRSKGKVARDILLFPSVPLLSVTNAVIGGRIAHLVAIIILMKGPVRFISHPRVVTICVGHWVALPKGTHLCC